MADRSGTKLKAKQVENLSEPGTYEDGNGLRLVIRATGSKGWVLRYQINGKRREMGLGPFDDKSLAQAREEANDARKLIRAGVDPLEARKAKTEADRQEQQQEAVGNMLQLQRDLKVIQKDVEPSGATGIIDFCEQKCFS